MKDAALAAALAADPPQAVLRPRRLLAMALATSIASTSGTSFVYPVLPVLAGDLNVDPSEIGLAMAVLTMPGIVLAPLFGVIADLRGRRWVLILGLTMFGIGGALASLAPSYGWFLACRAVQGVGLSALLPLTIVLISDVMSEEREIHGQGLKVVLDRVAMILLPLAGGLLAALSWRAAFAAYVCILPVALAAFVWMPETGTRHEGGFHQYLRQTVRALGERRLRVAFVTGFVRFFLDYGLYTYLPLLLALQYGASAVTAGWLIAASAGGSIVTAMSVGRLHLRVAPERLLAVAFLASAVGLVLVAIDPPLWLIALGAFLFGLGNGLISPLQKSLLTRRTPSALRGGVISVDRVIQQIAKSIAPTLMGLLLLVAPLEAVFWILAVMSLAGMLAVSLIAAKPVA
jgi:predicted MFS family arabinose efflux permease